MKRPIKLLMLSDSASAHTTSWLKGLSDNNLEVVLFSLHGELEPGIAALVEEGRIGLELGRGPARASFSWSFFSRLLALRKIVRSWRPDIVHAHYASSYGLLGALSPAKLFVISAWGSDIFEFPRKNTFTRGILKFNLRMASKVFSSSAVMAKETKRYTQSPIEVIPFGVETDEFSPGPEGPTRMRRIGTVKSMEHIYGIDLLIKAFNLLVNEYPELVLELVGRGSRTESYKELAHQLGIADKIKFSGRITHAQVPEKLRSFDIFVGPSRQESFGVSILEAMACGVPVVVSDAPGPAEIVQHGKNGLIAPVGGHLALYEMMKKLVEDQELRDRLGKAGRAHVVANYDRHLCAERMMEAYEGLANRHSG